MKKKRPALNRGTPTGTVLLTPIREQVPRCCDKTSGNGHGIARLLSWYVTMILPPVHFDAETVALLKKALDDAWARLTPEMQATMLKTTLAEPILKSAAQGERDHKRLRDAALRKLAA